MVKHPEYDDSQEGEGEGKGTQGGKSGEVGFRIKIETSRDDMLAPSEIRRLLKTHQEIHKSYIDKQKLLRKERSALKEGRKDLVAQYRAQHGLGGAGGSSPYKKHPISNKAQFSGIDKQVTSLPAENEAETNSELRAELENKYNHRLQPKRAFNPKPSPY
jgi:hypothetical protein